MEKTTIPMKRKLDLVKETVRPLDPFAVRASKSPDVPTQVGPTCVGCEAPTPPAELR